MIGSPIGNPQEVPLGPTCIYKAANSATQVNVAIQAADFSQIKPLIQDLTAATVAGHQTYCGTYGAPTLYAPLAAGTILEINAPCALAGQFATKALRRVG